MRSRNIFTCQLLIKCAGVILLTFSLLGCNTNKKTIDSRHHSAEKYVDYLVFNLTAVEITSNELVSAIEQLKKESLSYQPFNEFDDYAEFIIVSTMPGDELEHLILTITYTYQGVFAFPGGEDADPFQHTRYPFYPTILGITYIGKIPVIFSTRLSKFLHENDSNNPMLIRVTENTNDITAYAFKSLETDKWQIYPKPVIKSFYEIIDNELVFRRFYYSDGSLY